MEANGKVALGCLGAVILVVIFVILGFALNWFGAAVSVVSPDNVRTQYAQAYDDQKALKAIAQNICTSEKARDAEVKGTEAYTQRESQVLAQEQNYQRVQNHYDAYVSDPFRAKYVRPSDLPATAPTEADEVTTVCSQ